MKNYNLLAIDFVNVFCQVEEIKVSSLIDQNSLLDLQPIWGVFVSNFRHHANQFEEVILFFHPPDDSDD